MANKSASYFDGTSDYFTRTSALSGVSDSKKATISLWFKIPSSAATQYIYTIYTGATTYFYIRLTASGYMQFLCKDSAGNTVVYVDSSISGLSNDAWHHMMISFDNSQAQPAYLHFYIDGVNRLGTVNNWVDADTKWSNQYSTFGSYHTGGLMAGNISEFWMAMGLYVDLSVALNRILFYNAGKAPIVTGSGLGTPALYFPAGDAASNSGGGGNYTAVGAIDAATGPEIIPTNIYFDPTTGSATATSGTQGTDRLQPHTQVNATATPGTHTPIITPVDAGDPEGSDLPISIGIFI